MEKPLLSICIPTFNRAQFIKDCLDSITRQFSDLDIKNKVNLFVLDNISRDNTEEVVKEFSNIFDNVTYIKDDQNRDIIRGIIKAASYGNGEYVWIFSDDDMQAADSLGSIINFIKKHNSPELILANLAGFIEKDVIRCSNLLKTTEDLLLNNRWELFSLLNKKFYTSIDYYTTLCSNWIIKKEIFDKNYYIFDKYNAPLDMFPFPSLFFYSGIEYRTGIISKEIILNRGDNESWGNKNKIKHFFYKDKIWRDFYHKIIEHNREFLPKSFIFHVRIKNIIRFNELIKIVIIQTLRKLKIYDKLKKILNK